MWRSLALAFLLSVTVGPAWTQQATESKEMEAIKKTLQEHDEALNKQDLAALMDTYAANANILLMGTGPGEVWVGKQNIEETYKHFFKDFKAG
ncbi:MAG TPA: nuclear transport factor 2 family protein, partial [Candidatus Competibacteraceae bacterium]|nr:nuclear transport factor 2 family protein [Candidatus Competibacteraceae bacterium]